MLACGCGGMADAPASGAGGFTAVQVQVLSSAPDHNPVFHIRGYLFSGDKQWIEMFVLRQKL